jgi:hypothetical protein
MAVRSAHAAAKVGIVVCIMVCRSAAGAEPVQDEQDRSPKWYVQTGAYVHWISSDDFKGAPLFAGVEVHLKDDWSGGFSIFNNSFGQFTQYAYAGKSFRPWEARPDIRVAITAGIVHGYRDEYHDTLPIRWGGSWGIGVVPAIGIHKKRIGYDVALLGVSGLLFLVGFHL